MVSNHLAYIKKGLSFNILSNTSTLFSIPVVSLGSVRGLLKGIRHVEHICRKASLSWQTLFWKERTAPRPASGLLVAVDRERRGAVLKPTYGYFTAGSRVLRLGHIF